MEEPRCLKCEHTDDDFDCSTCHGYYDKFKPAKDNVNHPSHYEQSCSLECIQVMKLMFGEERVAWFCLCNAFKYMWRYKNKNGQEDLEKAGWYLSEVENHLAGSNVPIIDMCGRLTRLLSFLVTGDTNE